MSIKGHNSVANLRKMTIYNPNVDIVNDNVYTKFDHNNINAIRSQDIEQKMNSDVKINGHNWGPPQGFWGSGEKGYLFSGSWGALLIILGELGSKHILLGI